MKRKSKSADPAAVSADLNEAIVSLAASFVGYTKMAMPSVALIEGSAMFYDGLTMVGGFIGDRIDEIRGYAVTCAHAAKATRDASGMPTLEAAGAALESAMRKADSTDA